MARSCVVLLLDCVHFLTSDTAQTVESSPFWKMLKDGLTTSKWSTKFKTGSSERKEGGEKKEGKKGKRGEEKREEKERGEGREGKGRGGNEEGWRGES